MAYVSGTTGALTYSTVSYPITDWSLSQKVELAKFATSSSLGWKTGVPGTKDASGNCNIKLNAPPPPRGVIAAMVLQHGDFDGSGIRTYTFDAVITDVTVAVNVDTGEAVSAAVTFEAVGPVTEASS
jgi:hypothetical protein